MLQNDHHGKSSYHSVALCFEDLGQEMQSGVGLGPEQC